MSDAGGVLAAFDEHLRRIRGVCPGTRRNYARFVRAFLQSGTDLAVIALWLGHFSPAVTHQYLEPTSPPKKQYYSDWPTLAPTPTRFRPGDRLLAFLQDL